MFIVQNKQSTSVNSRHIDVLRSSCCLMVLEKCIGFFLGINYVWAVSSAADDSWHRFWQETIQEAIKNCEGHFSIRMAQLIPCHGFQIVELN